MIIKVDDTYNNQVMNYLKKEADFNLLIIGDIERYGYNNYFFKIWADIDDHGNVKAILLKCFEYLIFYCDDDYNVEEFCSLINTLHYVQISGKSKAIQEIGNKLNLKEDRVVNFCRLDNSDKLIEDNSKVKVKKIRFGKLKKIVKLYECIEEFENTTVQSIKNGLKSGRGYCIEINKKVIAMAKSTSENSTHAMIVGVATHPLYRNKGYATKCIIKICKELIKESKIPCLFYDNEEAGKIYHKLGFENRGTWSIYCK